MSGETPAVREALPAYAPEAPETERVPPGYRPSEVGVIPEDWDIVPLAELLDFRNGVNADKSAYGQGTPFINVLEIITHTHLRSWDIPGRVTLPSLLVNSYAVHRGDILFNRTSETQEEVGLASVYLGDETVVFGGFVIRGRNRGIAIDEVYSGYAFRSPIIRSQIISKGQGAVRANIGQQELSKVVAVLPPLPEQRAIATALSDMDALISALDKLIAKKRAVKTAAMQQLLTGKQRLPGFGGEWEVRRLGDVCQIISGGTPSTSVPAFWTGEIPWCTPTDITENNSKYLSTTNRTISEDGLKHSSAMLLPRGALLLCTRATIGEVKIAAVPVCTNQGFKSLVCGPDASNEFLFYKLVTLKDRLRELGVGSTFLEVSRKDVAALEISLPKLEEQTAIAAVLSDMDAEIEALAARREKTRQVKQGMMQELLTGRTRLV